VFVNKVLRRILGPERDEIRGDWRRMHDKKNFMICTPHQLGKRMRLVG